MSATTAKTKTKSVKRRARNSETKFCKKCKQDILENEKRDMFMSHDTYHKLQVRDYCKEHELLYHDQKCKPIWCDKCRYLMKYEITVDVDKK